tara:strand:+ start:10386 stop:11024 length:639 start_codon:yes stop_codon:yes gene_type:complete
MPQSVNPDFFVIDDDFLGVVFNATDSWTVVKDSGASVALAADTLGGAVLLSSAATTDDDGASIQGNEVFAATADKNIYFGARVQNESVAAIDFCVGLVENFATNPEAILTSPNRIAFQIDDGSGLIICKTEASGTETSTTTAVTAVDDTYNKLEISVSGTSVVKFYIDGQLVATHSTNIPTAGITPAMGHISGSATGTRTSQADYIIAAQTR